MSGYFPLSQWAEENFKNEPRLCRRCGGLGKHRRLICRRWRTCRSCHGTGGAIDDERAWWRAGK
jgi:DnaJ-class molecular chaperone